MTITKVKRKTTNSLYFASGSFFANAVTITDHIQMQELIGGDCIATRLRDDIILWHDENAVTAPDEHTLNLKKDGVVTKIFGNVLIISDDKDSIEGFRDLSTEQRLWLGDFSELAVSELTGNYINQFVLTKN